MGDIKKIMEDEIAKLNPPKVQKAKSASELSPERKKKGKTQWKKLPLDEVGKTSKGQGNSGKSSQPKKVYQNNEWKGSGSKTGQNSSKSNLKSNDKGNGATKPWAHSATSQSGKSSKSQGAANAKGKGSYLTATSGQPTQSNHKETSQRKGNEQNKGHGKQSKQKKSKPQQNKNNKDQMNKDSSKSGTNGKQTVSAQANPYQPSSQSSYGQGFEYQNNYGAPYNSFETGFGYDFSSGYYVPPPSLEETAEYARHQIEYYFTTENLLRDMFLRAQFDEAGYVPISLLANFRAVYNVHQDYNSLVTALSSSTILEVDMKYELVRLRDGWKHWIIPNGAGGFGQPSYAKSAEVAESEKTSDGSTVEEPQKESEPTDNAESSSVVSSDSETTDITTKKMEDLKIEAPPMAAAH